MPMPDDRKYVPEFYPNNSKPVGEQMGGEFASIAEALKKFFAQRAGAAVPVNQNGFPLGGGGPAQQPAMPMAPYDMARGR